MTDIDQHGGDETASTVDANATTHGIQVFSAPSDAPRVRWETDLAAAGMWSFVLVVLIVLAGNGSTLDTNTLGFVGTFPGWLLWLGQAAYVIGVVYSFGLLIGVGLFARGRLELLADMLLAAALAVVGVLALTGAIDNRWPEFAIFDLDEPRETFPAFFVTTSAAIQAAASPHLSEPMRKMGWTLILAAVGSSVLGGVTTISDALGGLLVGLVAAALTRYVFGTTSGLPSTNRIRSGLADLGVEMADLSYAEHQPAVSVVLTGTSTDGRPLFVSGLGRDSWSTRRWTRLWKQAWYHDQGSQYGADRRQQIEHEALAMLLAAKGDAPVPELVMAGMTARDDALLVAGLCDHTLADVADADVDDHMLDAIWAALDKLHQVGISHGSLDSYHVWFDAAGLVSLMGYTDAALNAGEEQLHGDIAAMLTLMTTIVGADRAIASARRAHDDDVLTAMLPLLQTASLNGPLRHRVKHQKLKVKDLRKETADALGIDVPEPEQLTRVSWKGVITLGFILFAVYTLISGLADVGFDTIVDTFSDARWSLVLLALFLAGATNYTDAIGVAAVAPKPVPVGITTIEQLAIGFIDLAVPSSAGKIGTNVRYFQKFGMSAGSSLTNGVVTGVTGIVAQIIVVTLAVLVGAGSIDLSELEGGGGAIRLVIAAIAILAGAIIVTLIVPTLRHWAWSKLQKPVSEMRDSLQTVKNPRTILTTLGGSIGTEVLYGASLMACVLAMGGSIRLGEAIFINVTVSLVAAISPVPGNAGVAEAGLTAGLTSVGVDNEVAVSAVIAYRMVSTYLPPIWGYGCLRWLTHHDYL